MAQVVEHLPGKCKALSSNPRTHTHTHTHKSMSETLEKSANSQLPRLLCHKALRRPLPPKSSNLCPAAPTPDPMLPWQGHHAQEPGDGIGPLSTFTCSSNKNSWQFPREQPASRQGWAPLACNLKCQMKCPVAEARVEGILTQL
jgi:hypothetical protein